MEPAGASGSQREPAIDPQGIKKVDRVAYAAIGVYSLINIIWSVWASSGAGFGIFDTVGLIGILVPILGVFLLIVFQCSSPQNRFSLFANLIAIFAMVGWFLVVWCIFAEAVSAV
ncbi:hypothetical protein N8525_02285 [Verrucomicrobiales bacterium]|nr:hypothetical protein [Verrucomicrobiales bacterium]